MKAFKLFFSIACLIFLGFSQMSAQAIHQNVKTPAQELFKNATPQSPLILTHKEIPNYCFGHRRPNPFMKLSKEQLNIFTNYGYPKFISTGYTNLEKDILEFQNAVKLWERDNEDNIETINEALGIIR